MAHNEVKKMMIDAEKNSQGTNHKEPPKSVDSFNTKVVGVTAQNANGVPVQKILASLSSYARIKLVREPHNAYDKNAIMVFADGKHIGYLSSYIASQYAALIDLGDVELSATINQITGGQPLNYGCNLNIKVSWYK
jgi:hypothetical protein